MSERSAANISLRKYGPDVRLMDASRPSLSVCTVTDVPTGPTAGTAGVVEVDGWRVKSSNDAPIIAPITRTAASVLTRRMILLTGRAFFEKSMGICGVESAIPTCGSGLFSFRVSSWSVRSKRSRTRAMICSCSFGASGTGLV